MTVLASKYDPTQIEDKWYGFWMDGGYFTADAEKESEKYVIAIPPPNVTDVLHLGHALNNTLQDALIRWKRMAGYNALWVPGTDHAGIATQNVVERDLMKRGQSREDLGREKFVERVWEWKKEYGGAIIDQLKKLGCSCDWTRERFTLDEGLSRAVRTAFKRLFDEGLIYRGNYIVNWCPRCHTALADDEVEHRDHQDHLWHIKYPIEGSDAFLVVATTRPETMLGDTAVAVNPGDERYKNLVGKHAILPIMERRIVIIADDFVDKEFGTGQVKVTPAHDPNDHMMGKRHDLEEINILNPNATINENGGKYQDMDRYECRKQIVEDLKEMGLMEKIEDYGHSVGHCYRCDTVIEPYISEQWFVKIRPLAEPAIDAVRNGTTRFVPEFWQKTYFHWLENVRDWCISRQLWWGHRIPVWYCGDCDGMECSADDAPETCGTCGSTNLRQDEDVLDTWFSSALWPFSTLGWPGKTRDLEVFYPTSTLVTAHEIIFLWVARMIMTGIKFVGETPFTDVYINSVVCDEHGEKMSKSKGNGIDPRDVTAEFGTDAMRLALCAYAAKGRNVNISMDRIKGYRNFINKLWNASRFILMNTEDLTAEALAKGLNNAHLTIDDTWILSRFRTVIDEYSKLFETYDFDKALHVLYHYVWHEFCDWYVEMVKPRLYSKEKEDYDEAAAARRANAQIILVSVLEGLLRLLHPIIPFVTEDLWQKIKERYAPDEDTKTASDEKNIGEMALASFCRSALIIAPWLGKLDDAFDNPEAEEAMSLITDVVYSIRNIRGEMDVPPGEKTDVYIDSNLKENLEFLRTHSHYITSLVAVENLYLGEMPESEKFSSSAAVHDVKILVPLPEHLRKRELERLEKQIAKLEQQKTGVEKKLSNKNFTSKAPEAVIQKQRDQLDKLTTEMNHLKERVGQLEG